MTAVSKKVTAWGSNVSQHPELKNASDATHVLAGLVVAEAGGLEGCVARSVLVPFMLPEFLVGLIVAQPVLCLVSALFPFTNVTTPTSCM